MADAPKNRSIMAQVATDDSRRFFEESIAQLDATIPELEKWVKAGIASQADLDRAVKARSEAQVILDTIGKVSRK